MVQVTSIDDTGRVDFNRDLSLVKSLTHSRLKKGAVDRGDIYNGYLGEELTRQRKNLEQIAGMTIHLKLNE